MAFFISSILNFKRPQTVKIEKNTAYAATHYIYFHTAKIFFNFSPGTKIQAFSGVYSHRRRNAFDAIL